MTDISREIDIHAVQELSKNIIETLVGKPNNIAVISLLDVATRIVSEAEKVNVVDAINRLITTLAQIGEAEAAQLAAQEAQKTPQ